MYHGLLSCVGSGMPLTNAEKTYLFRDEDEKPRALTASGTKS